MGKAMTMADGMIDDMTQPLRIGLAGLGTVGVGLLRLIEGNNTLLAERGGVSLGVTAVSARERGRDRGVDLSGFAWEDDMTALAARGDVDVVVEVVGGSSGAALELARATLGAGKAFVTANKALIAEHGHELAQLAEANDAALLFEAAVAGGIPVVKGLREGAAANRVERLYGILNGTSNFILSEMETSGRAFADVLGEAQEKGYAEADPSFDIGGIDAAHKLAILAAIGFGTQLDFAGVKTEGIDRLRPADVAEAARLGHVIRLVAMARPSGGEEGALLQKVAPMLVPLGHPLAHVTGPTNAVVVEGDFAGRLLFQGAGAGAEPTASAVAADLVDLARGMTGPAFAVPTDRLMEARRADHGANEARFYLRFSVYDRPGVLAELTAAMRDAGVSIETMMQRGQSAEGGEVLVMMVSHHGRESCVRDALEALGGSDVLTDAPLALQLLAD